MHEWNTFNGVEYTLPLSICTQMVLCPLNSANGCLNLQYVWCAEFQVVQLRPIMDLLHWVCGAIYLLLIDCIAFTCLKYVRLQVEGHRV